MDQTIREATRFFQATGDFGSLTEALDAEGLEKLIQQAMVAKIGLSGVSLQVTHLPKLDYEIIDPKMGQPRILYTEKSKLDHHLVSELPKHLSELPISALVKLFCQFFYPPIPTNPPVPLTLTRAARRVGRGGYYFDSSGLIVSALKVLPSQYAAEARDRQSPGVAPYFYTSLFLMQVWKETSESFQRYKNKKLRERGLIPGKKAR